jgi:hypothetical protein
LADNNGMKSTAVQFPQPFSVAVSEIARVSAKHGSTAYALSLICAGAAFFASVFYKEISHTFGYSAFGVRAATVWHAVFFAGFFAWVAATLLALLCLPQRGRTRTYALSSLGMNFAAAVLLAVTML